ncbi:MAG: AAA family ATPase [Cyclobacteriaceae bacterium]
MSEGKLDPKDMQNEINRLNKHIQQQDRCSGVFAHMNSMQWMKESNLRPIPKMLFSEFWYEQEICILFADTNVGKSILAVQIANSISKGIPIVGFKLEAEKQQVIYFDFELSDKQFEGRYSKNYNDHYPFDDNLIRAEINSEAEIPKKLSFEEYLNESLELIIEKLDSRVLIIDNMTYLRNETERAKEALPLMKHLKALKSKYNLSILVLAHTPKRDLSKPINRNDLQGSKMLINFCDSSFAIGESVTQTNLRYLKQIKQRNTEHLYDTGNVIVCQVNKPHNFLRFEFLEFGDEREHLKEYNRLDQEQRLSEAQELRKQGKSNREIARVFHVSEGAIRKWFKKAGDEDNQ